MEAEGDRRQTGGLTDYASWELGVWCREQDLNLHAFWALDPKSNASANSAIPAFDYFNRRVY